MDLKVSIHDDMLISVIHKSSPIWLLCQYIPLASPLLHKCAHWQSTCLHPCFILFFNMQLTSFKLAKRSPQIIL